MRYRELRVTYISRRFNRIHLLLLRIFTAKAADFFFAARPFVAAAVGGGAAYWGADRLYYGAVPCAGMRCRLYEGLARIAVFRRLI